MRGKDYVVSEDAEGALLRRALRSAGHLVPTPLAGVYGFGRTFEEVVAAASACVGRTGRDLGAEAIRFPPVLSRRDYEKTHHFESFPHLTGSVHSYFGSEEEHRRLLMATQEGADWSAHLGATDVVLAPAACFPLYPVVRGTLPPEGRVFDLQSFCFRHEPSPDPARLQMFRMREYVRLGSADQALRHRDEWLRRAMELTRRLGLEPRAEAASDPFFGRGGRQMAASQREQALKFEVQVAIASADRPTAIVSSNYHVDAFGKAFGIRSADGRVAHSACVGFGLERIALALFATHGMRPRKWPSEVRRALEL